MPILQSKQELNRLEDYLLAILHTKRFSLFPMHELDSFKGLALARKKLIDRLVTPMYPTKPLIGLYEETAVRMEDYYPRDSQPMAHLLPHVPLRTERLGCTPDGKYVWVGFRRRSEAGLRKLHAPFKNQYKPIPYEQHVRVIFPDGSESYDKDIIALHDKAILPYLLPIPRGSKYHWSYDDLLDMCNRTYKELASQIWFKIHMANFWQVQWSYAGKELIFPATEHAVRELGRLRDGPRTTLSGRRNPLLHWVTEHLRRISTGDEERLIPISEHLRGTERFVIDDYAAEIINPVKPTT